MLDLHLDCLAMDFGGACMMLSLGSIRTGALRVGGFSCPAVRHPLVGNRSSLALARALLAGAGFDSVLWMVHTCMVPRVGTCNQPVHPPWSQQTESRFSTPGWY